MLSLIWGWFVVVQAARLQRGAAAESSMQKSIAAELEWVQSNAKGQQKKGKARMRRYEDLVEQVPSTTNCCTKY